MKTRFLIMASVMAMTLAACSHHVTPAAPPPPPPPPPPPMHWEATTVYFDFEKANLTSAAADAIAEAVAHHPPHESVTGFCDSAEHHCHDLAMRRADAVKDELIRRGMPADLIQTHASDDLAVPTKNHVREPRNRRAVIDPR